MGIIRPYGDLPRMYTPDVGEVVEARRNPADKFVRAVALHSRRKGDGSLRVKVQWLDSDPDAGAPNPGKGRVPIVAGAIGLVIMCSTDDRPPLIRQINGGAKPVV